MKVRGSSYRIGVATLALMAISCSMAGCDSERDAGSETSAGGAGPIGPAPAAGPSSSTTSSGGGAPFDGWVEYTDWSPECTLYVPDSPAALPPPMSWIPCPESPDGIQCQMLAPEWNGEYYTVDNPFVGTDAQGNVVLYMVRTTLAEGGYDMHLVSDLDGSIRFALIHPGGNAGGCRLYNEGFCGGRHIINMYGHATSDDSPSSHAGAIGGPIDQLHPTVLFHDANIGPLSWRCSSNRVARFTSSFVLTVHPWDMSSEAFVTSPATDPQALKVNETVMRDGVVFFETSTLPTSGINVWDPVNGVRPFLRWVGDPTRGAESLGTDGVDLVWSEGDDKDPNTNIYATRSVMTAPYTTDPAFLVPRRLRSHPDDIQAVFGWEVGCGYGVFDGGAGNVMLVRVSDGQGWFIPNTNDQRMNRHRGVTCDEVFASGTSNGDWTLFRVRIDSLGPGLPAD